MREGSAGAAERTALAPTPAGERLEGPDVLRGFALLGILVVNLPYFVFPAARVWSPPSEHAGEVLSAGIVRALFELKFVGLFALLFGAGLVLQTRRADAARRSLRATWLRRLGVLALLGVAHGVLLFAGDILLPYAVIGTGLFLCRRWSPRRLAASAAVLLAVGLALELAWGAFDGLAGAALADASDDAGPAAGIRARARDYAEWLAFSALISFDWRVAAFFLLGAAATRLELWSPARLALHRRLALLGLSLGLPAEILSTWLAYGAGEGGGAIVRALRGSAAAGLHELGSTALVVGYAAAVLVAVGVDRLPRLRSALAAAGRLALTNYLAQSVLATCLVVRFHGEIPRLALLPIAFGIFALQAAASALWLRRFATGPLEWVWRRLAYARPLPSRG